MAFRRFDHIDEIINVTRAKDTIEITAAEAKIASLQWLIAHDGPAAMGEYPGDDGQQAHDIPPKNILLRLSFTTPITLAPGNASSRSDEWSTAIASIFQLSKRMAAVSWFRRG